MQGKWVKKKWISFIYLHRDVIWERRIWYTNPPESLHKMFINYSFTIFLPEHICKVKKKEKKEKREKQIWDVYRISPFNLIFDSWFINLILCFMIIPRLVYALWCSSKVKISSIFDEHNQILFLVITLIVLGINIY